MREGYLLKSMEGSAVTAQELDMVNRYTRRPFGAEEIYTFTVVLCDNEVDRDFERFTPAALEALSGLYLGKTGIFDHSMKGADQTARIYAAGVEWDESRTTAAGEPYCCLVAKAYLPRTAKNEDFIVELESGIKKEVSVGCAVAKSTCSICGKDRKTEGCAHIKGRYYGSGLERQLCHTVLEEPTDAYEWSFVAVPAQREAGVIKGFSAEKREWKTMEEIKKALASGEEVLLAGEKARELAAKIAGLEELADCGREYREQVRKNVLRLCALVQPELPSQVLQRVTGQMSLEDLQAFEKAFQAGAEKLLPARPQLAAKAKPRAEAGNQEFKI